MVSGRRDASASAGRWLTQWLTLQWLTLEYG